MSQFVGLYNYWVVIFLMMTGFYIVIARSNLIQKVIGLNIFQISVFLLYITMGKVTGGTAPILPYHAGTHHDAVEIHVEASAGDAQIAPVDEASSQDAHADHDEVAGSHDHDHPTVYSHPLPSVLMLTAIVVGVATTSLALALVIRIGEAYGSIEEDEILQKDRESS